MEAESGGREAMRVKRHPVLGESPRGRPATIYLDGRPIRAIEGEPVAAALYAAGVRVTRYSARRKEPRGAFCMIGRCAECRMKVDGIPNVRTCQTAVREGMRVETPGASSEPGD
jgi:sarcosine oxidase subunit alpha